MNQELINRISQSTVCTVLPGSKMSAITGQGILLNSGFILTAEACVAYDAVAISYFAEGCEFTQDVITAGELRLSVTPWMIDPVSGIALLGPVDAQNIPTLAMGLEDFIQKISPIPLFRGRLSSIPLPIRIQNRRGVWVNGYVSRQERWPHRVLLYIKERVKDLTTGSPVVTEGGELFGVVPQFTDESETPRGTEAFMAIAHLALPFWATRRKSTRDRGRVDSIK